MRAALGKFFIAVSFLFFSTNKLFSTDLKVPLKNNAVILRFENFVGMDSLKLDDVTYKNEIGQSYTVSKFKYYISNISLKTDAGKEFIVNRSYLIDEEETGAQTIELKDVPAQYYTSINFIIGVDSLHNCSGIQAGDLDPVKGMFWAWNTGYIFLKLEGKSPSSTTKGNIFEYHIGGFTKPNNCIRRIHLKIEKSVGENEIINVIQIKTDIAEIFKNPNTIDFAKTAIVTDAKYATDMANNYSDIFSIIEVK